MRKMLNGANDLLNEDSEVSYIEKLNSVDGLDKVVKKINPEAVIIRVSWMLIFFAISNVLKK